VRGRQPAGQFPFLGDQFGRMLVLLVEIGQKTLLGNLVLGLQPRSRLVAVPNVHVAEQLVAEAREGPPGGRDCDVFSALDVRLAGLK